ncbi:VOC family protein [Rickettsiales bacterium LUAb2]
MKDLNPYISFNGRAKEAVDFYVAALGAKVQFEHYYSSNPEISDNMPDDWKNKLMLAKISLGNFMIMISDVSFGDKPGQVKELNYTGCPITLTLNFETEEAEVEAFNKMSEGATIDMPLQDTSWNAKVGMLTDKFGIKWLFDFDK